MATSPIYNWPEPDNTDLVKNGALAIRTMGDAIDTTMGTMIPKSFVDSKGDLIAATANDTPARLAVGANGTLLIADSTQSTGLAYVGTWTTWSPTLTNVTKGNGTETARYRKVGTIVSFYYQLTLGSTSLITGRIIISLPVNHSNGRVVIPVHLEDTGTALYYGMATLQGNNINIDAINSSATYAAQTFTGASVPFIWTTGDIITVFGTYEVAA